MSLRHTGLNYCSTDRPWIEIWDDSVYSDKNTHIADVFVNGDEDIDVMLAMKIADTFCTAGFTFLLACQHLGKGDCPAELNLDVSIIGCNHACDDPRYASDCTTCWMRYFEALAKERAASNA